jgi:hypothetical protein
MEPGDCVQVGEDPLHLDTLKILYSHPRAIGIEKPDRPMILIRGMSSIKVWPGSSNTIGVTGAYVDL